jgi:hypothetical protein
MSMRQALTHHAWAIGQMKSRMRPGPANLRHHNAVMGCLRHASFSPRTALHAYSALDSYTYGFALQERTLHFETPAEPDETPPKRRGTIPRSTAEDYPFLIEVVIELRRSGYDPAVEFEVGLDLLLDGIEKLRAEWTTATG